MPLWLQAAVPIAAAITCYVVYRKWRREDRDRDQDRLVNYLDRIAVMLGEMADELESGRTSPARCTELFQAIRGVDQLIWKSRTALAVSHKNELLEALRGVVDPPARLNMTRTRELMQKVDRLLEVGASQPSHTLQSTRDLETIRKASGLFKGAAEFLRAQ
ncbi:MAG: hypothetical protein JWN04_6512 [Myxococcaceae bacterium]|nr:hypothetical protein [Myxococcaceae bacterium]